jgi:RNA polymerase sigma-70 factor (ECF subfamily)
VDGSDSPQSGGGLATNHLTQPGRLLIITMTTARAGFTESTLRWRLPFRPVTSDSGRHPERPRSPQLEADQLDAAMAAVARGERDSFARLYDLVIPVVFGLIRRLLRDPSQSEEVTQEVMVEVWRTAPRYDPTQGSAMGWILTIARRRAIDRIRSEQAQRDRVERVAPGQIEREHDQVSEAVLRSSDRGAVSHALATLGDLQREAIELAFFGGLTQSEIAGRLGVPLGTVKTRIRDGMLRLKETLSTSR